MKNKKVENIITAILAAAVLITGGMSLYSYLSEQKAKNEYDTIRQEAVVEESRVEETEEVQVKNYPDLQIDFANLKKTNPDFRGWLYFPALDISYPVVQGEDNFTYVNTDVYGDFSLAGSIFLDVNCDKNFTDPYSLLYGHHMEESKMFGDLDLYKDAEFFAENTTGELILPDRTYDLQTFACLLVPSSESAIFQPQRWDSDLQGLYTFAQENALNLNTETLAAMKAAGDDAQVLALSTCSTEFTDARTILLAWMIPSASDS